MFVEGLIKLLAAGTSRNIERGSALHATIGAMLLGAIGVVIAYIGHTSGSITKDWGFAMVGLGVSGGLAGAVIGSLIPRRATSRAPWEQKVTLGSSVRLYDLNRGLVAPLGFLAVVGGCTAAIIAVVAKGMDLRALAGEMIVTELIFFTVGLFLGITAFRSVLWVDLGTFCRIRYSFHSRVYKTEEITDWIFILNSGHRTATPVANVSQLILRLNDEKDVAVPIDSAKAGDVAAILQLRGVASLPPPR